MIENFDLDTNDLKIKREQLVKALVDMDTIVETLDDPTVTVADYTMAQNLYKNVDSNVREVIIYFSKLLGDR
jgi:hypothetical protein